MAKPTLTLLYILCTACFSNLFALNTDPADSTKRKALHFNDIVISETRSQQSLSHADDIDGQTINAAKKSDIIHLDRTNANVITNTARQVFGKIAGISVWESDASGIQINVSCRGLSPNRSWEFNVRQNGIDIAADPFGYPEAYYNPPLEAVEKIHIVRGAAALQYGPQFGGMLNYQLRRAPENKKIEVESRNSTGSFGLFSSYNSVGGTIGKFSYFGFYQYRKANGWRQNNKYNIHNGYANLEYRFSEKVKLGAEFTYMNYVCQQPGGLTDSMFHADPRQSIRTRNWFSVPWMVPTLNLEVNFNKNHSLSVRAFSVIGQRNSVGFTSSVLTPDTLNPATGEYRNRQLDRDAYKNAGIEIRHLARYRLFKQNHAIAFGAKYYYGNTLRQQQGKGNTGTDYSMQLIDSTYVRDLRFHTHNAALFAENMLTLTPRLKITQGVRIEILNNHAAGRLNYKTSGEANNITPQQSTRVVALAGLGLEYNPVGKTFLYGNFSQAYRPVMFADLTPAATTDSIDQKLKDAHGFNADLGYRGSVGNWLSFDINGFYMLYHNKIGSITQLNQNGTTYQLKSNLGTAHHRGIEAYLEIDPFAALKIHQKAGNLSLFASCTYVDARYTSFRVVTYNSATAQLTESNLKNNRVEYAPAFTNRFGATYTYRILSLTYQFNHTGAFFTDASNTLAPTANAQAGKLPAYTVMDLSATLQLTKFLTFRGGVNNFTNTRYATRRAGGYPGPGLLPADGRNWFLSMGVKF